MGVFCSLLLLSASIPVFAASGDTVSGTGSLTTGSGTTVSSGAIISDPAPVIPAAAISETPDATFIDIGKVVTSLRIRERLSDLRAVTTDPAGKNYGFYFANVRKKTFTVYRNGRKLLTSPLENTYQLQKPTVFRMTASGDLLHAADTMDLYVNDALVTSGKFSFGVGVGSVHDEGGILTYPEGGNVVTYTIATGKKRTLYRHSGKMQYLRRRGATVAYTLQERGGVHMYRNGRRVSERAVVNAHNFAISKTGEAYFFTSSARGYALFRNARSYVTGRGNGAFVDVDPTGNIWHISYTQTDLDTDVKLQKNRQTKNLLPEGVANVELSLAFPDGTYAIRGSFEGDKTLFSLLSDGNILGEEFLFEPPHNDTHGFALLDDVVIFRAHDGTRWRIHADGEYVDHPTLKKAWYFRVSDGELTVYATK